MRLRTQSGLEGFGLASSYTASWLGLSPSDQSFLGRFGSEAIEPLVKPWTNGLADLILGEDALAPERLYQKLFRLTANKAPPPPCLGVRVLSRFWCQI